MIQAMIRVIDHAGGARSIGVSLACSYALEPQA